MADLSKYSRDELQQLKKDIDKEIAGRRKDEEKKAKEEMKQVAEKYGFSLGELVGSQPIAKAKGKGKANAKFVHPDDPSKTWSGRGRKPVWIKEWESEGKSLDSLRVA